MPQLLPGDNPQAYIPGDRRRSLARGQDLPAVTHGSGVFVDISGFTKLTEALVAELGGRRGAEVLSANIDRIFAALMEPLHHHGGSGIYFSGDAVTAWIDRDDGSAATAWESTGSFWSTKADLVTYDAADNVFRANLKSPTLGMVKGKTYVVQLRVLPATNDPQPLGPVLQGGFDLGNRSFSIYLK